MYFIFSFPANGKSEKRFFVKKEDLCPSALSSSGLTNGATCINGLEESSVRAGGGNAELGTGLISTRRNGNGTVKLKGSPGGCAEEKSRTPDLDEDTDDRGGWEKATLSWKKVKQKRGWKGRKTQKKKSSLIDDCDDDASPDYVPNKRTSVNKFMKKTSQPSSVYTQPDQRVRGSAHSQHTPHWDG